MSWRSKRNNKYNRAEDVEYFNYFMEEEQYQMCPWMHDWDDPPYWDYAYWHYPGGGHVSNMEEYHQMKLLTLLRLLNIRSTLPILKNNGW